MSRNFEKYDRGVVRVADFFVRVIDDSCELRSLFEEKGDWEAGKLAERGCLHKNEKRDQTSEIERDAKTSEEMSV